MKKRTKYIIGGIIFLIILFFIFGKKGGAKDHVFATIDTVTTQNIIETITASGKIQPEMEVKISPDVSGEIIELHVAEGDSVKSGQLLIVINPDLYEADFARMKGILNQAKANLASSQSREAQSEAQLLQAELNYKRNKALYEKNVISASEWEQISTQYKVAQAEYKAAQESVVAAKYNVISTEAQLNQTSNQLKRTRIVAPMDGIISKLAVEKGERVVGTAQMTGTEMLRVANLDNMEIRVEVNENDIIKVKLGDTAYIEVDSYLNRKFTGVVTQIANSPTTSNSQISTDEVTNFEVRIRILSDSYKDLMELKGQMPFRPGMSASVDIVTSKANNAIAVPTQAVTIRENLEKEDYAGNPFEECVFVLENGKAKRIWVQTGIQNSRYIQIISGLTEGQVIIAGPYSLVSKDLEDGKEIQIKKDK